MGIPELVALIDRGYAGYPLHKYGAMIAGWWQ